MSLLSSRVLKRVAACLASGIMFAGTVRSRLPGRLVGQGTPPNDEGKRGPGMEAGDITVKSTRMATQVNERIVIGTPDRLQHPK